MTPSVETFYDKRSGTASHLVWCAHAKVCAVIDPVFDLDPKSGHTSRKPVDDIADFVRDSGLRLEWILETHIHHDHISGAAELRRLLGGRIAIGERVGEVAAAIAGVYGLDAEGRCLDRFDRQLADGETIALGDLAIEVMATPGHTLDHLSFVVGDAVFTGDTLFMPDSGTARCDFHKGDAARLFHSIHRILDRPDDAILFACHDYGASGRRAPAWRSSVGSQRRANIHVGNGAVENEFVALRNKRDAGLDMPQLMLHALPLNIRAGDLPAPAAHGRIMLSIPLDVPRDAM
ncbi:MBL fold metallo-hydrolase [Bosea beijingensis]|uniref:MBL fold metallo-hydrolase n=1 Tax=Bosea beijingensis TaxID=3068632 RepID=UPI00274132EC|nr:MBL fold metallo-hydrolase [Bosea sp. REN20]